MAKIIQISAVVEPHCSDATIYGLGENGKVYWWDAENGEWHVWEK